MLPVGTWIQLKKEERFVEIKDVKSSFGVITESNKYNPSGKEHYVVFFFSKKGKFLSKETLTTSANIQKVEPPSFAKKLKIATLPYLEEAIDYDTGILDIERGIVYMYSIPYKVAKKVKEFDQAKTRLLKLMGDSTTNSL